MPSFKVPCPSCEAPVLIKNPNLVGTKVECPKCKYRFKVEEPPPEAAAEAKKDDAKGKKADSAKKKPAGGKNKKLVPIIVGVGAVIVLAVVGITMFGGGGGKKPSGSTGGPAIGPGTGPTEDPNTPKVEPKKDDKPQPGFTLSGKNTTNLLPGQAVAVYRFNLDKIRESPMYEMLADPQMTEMFQRSMGFSMDDVEIYFHCFAGENRAPFGVIRLKYSIKTENLLAGLKPSLQPKPKSIKNRDLYAISSNPVITGVSHALSMASLFGDQFQSIPMAPPAGAKEKPMGLCIYDSQHVIIGDYALLDSFLGELDANGYPPSKTVMLTAPTGAPPAKGADASEKPFTSVDTYRSVEFPLKKALDEMEADRLHTPMVVYAEKFDARQYDPKLLKKDLSLLSRILDPILAKTRYVSANVLAFNQQQLLANLRLTLGSNLDAPQLAKEQLAPGLELLAELLKLHLASPVEFRDYTQGGTTTSPNSGFPQYPMGMGDPGMGVPGMGSPGMGGPPPIGGPTPGMGSSGGPPPGMGSSLGPPPGMGGPPPMPGGGPMPGPGPGPMPGPGMEQPKDPVTSRSHIDLGMTDRQLHIAIDLNWDSSIYRTVVAPRAESIANQIKGKMAIFSSELSWQLLAAAGPKAEEGLKAFPRGTAERQSNLDRFGLPYPPTQRVSLFVDLLPYLGRAPLKAQVNTNLAWYDKENLRAAGAWVPELLVPYYPHSAWRATSPFAPNHTFGATNYVAIAGVGLDIPRQDPNSPEFKKKVGITGYGWGSKAEEITDGLSNTIYLMQTPPGLQQPWIAGGGATVRGLDENDPMSGFRYTHPNRAKQGTYALMADGSVRWIPADIDPKVLKALATRAGAEALADLDTHAPRANPPKPKPKPEPEPKKPDDKAPSGKVELAPPPREKK